MGGNMLDLTNMKAKRLLVFFVVTIFLTFSVALTIGYIISSLTSASNKNEISNNITEVISRSCSASSLNTDSGQVYVQRQLERHGEMFACVHSSEECWDYGLPRTYLVYHLNGKTIDVDGKLDDEAWLEVPWSDEFVDIRSFIYEKPWYDTKFKMRWDDRSLYIGVYMQEHDLWATYTDHDADVYEEHALDILLGIDGYSFNYKQVTVNVLGTIMDLLMFKSPHKYGFAHASDINWNLTSKCLVYPQGTVNKPGDIDKYWSVEVELSFEQIAARFSRDYLKPNENEVWSANLGRSQPNITVQNGTYKMGSSYDWYYWVWQPLGVFDMHLPSRWGLIQFKHNLQETTFRFQKWHIYKALFDVYDALQKFKALTGSYTYEIEALDVPPYLLSRTCVCIPDIFVRGSDFNVTIMSLILPKTAAHIRSDKTIIFH